MSHADEARDVLHNVMRAVYKPVYAAGCAYAQAQKAATTATDLVEVMQATVGVILAAEHLKDMATEAEKSARDALAEQMDATGAAKIQTEHQTAYLSRKPAFVNIEQEDMVPAEYIRQPPPAPDKKAIKAAIDDGVLVPGCTLVVPNSQTLVIRRKN